MKKDAPTKGFGGWRDVMRVFPDENPTYIPNEFLTNPQRIFHEGFLWQNEKGRQNILPQTSPRIPNEFPTNFLRMVFDIYSKRKIDLY